MNPLQLRAIDTRSTCTWVSMRAYAMVVFEVNQSGFFDRQLSGP